MKITLRDDSNSHIKTNLDRTEVLSLRGKEKTERSERYKNFWRSLSQKCCKPMKYDVWIKFVSLVEIDTDFVRSLKSESTKIPICGFKITNLPEKNYHHWDEQHYRSGCSLQESWIYTYCHFDYVDVFNWETPPRYISTLKYLINEHKKSI